MESLMTNSIHDFVKSNFTIFSPGDLGSVSTVDVPKASALIELNLKCVGPFAGQNPSLNFSYDW